MENSQYADLLAETAALLHVSGANPFRIRAVERAARTIRGLAQSIDELLDTGSVTSIDGIGASLAKDLAEIRVRRSTDALDELRAALPDGIIDVLKVQGLGPKKVRRLYEDLGIGDLDALEAAAGAGQLQTLPGFGARTEEKILNEITRLRSYAGRTPFGRARRSARQILNTLRSLDGVVRAEAAGSLRRRRETVGDLDFVVASDTPGPIMEAFCSMDEVESVVASGDTKSTVRLIGGLSADLRVVPPEVFGATLHHFTGSKDHNVEMRARAMKRGLRVSEWGVFRRGTGDGGGDTEERVACESEEDVYAAVGLEWIPPELREGRGEIDAAERGALPNLIENPHILGDLHMHTVASDGRADFDDMAAAAARLGRSYIAITDHSRSLHVANGLSRERLLTQIASIDEFNSARDADTHAHVLKGLEADIMDDGSIDMDVDVLEQLDWVVGSVHQWMSMPGPEMTERLVRAVRSGLISAIGHPTGRLIGSRDPFDYDFDAVLEACAEMGVALEVNAAPERLDLNDLMLRRALEHDVWITINTDAHSVAMLENMDFGVGMARRGGVPKDRVLNALPLDEFMTARRRPSAR